jgi:hypothetical protein
MVEAQDGAAIAELEDARVRVDLRLDGLASRMEQ